MKTTLDFFRKLKMDVSNAISVRSLKILNKKATSYIHHLENIGAPSHIKRRALQEYSKIRKFIRKKEKMLL
jgi:hypothetical protein